MIEKSCVAKLLKTFFVHVSLINLKHIAYVEKLISYYPKNI